MASTRPEEPAGLQAADVLAEMLEEATRAAFDSEAKLTALARSSVSQTASEMRGTLDIWSPFGQNGPDFVRRVYLELLSREPDERELAELSSALVDGRLSKIEIMGRVRFSPEGKAFGRSVPTLRL